MSYSWYRLTNLYTTICCCVPWCTRRWPSCQKRIRDAKTVKIARAKLIDELDLFELMKVLRIASFMARLKLNRQQRTTVEYFRRYMVRPDETEILTAKEKRKDETELPTAKEKRTIDIVADIRPYENKIDQRIHYELTGKKINEAEFSDSSSVEDLSKDMRRSVAVHDIQELLIDKDFGIQ